MPNTRRIASFEVPAIGLGCMNLSHAYGQPPETDAAERLLLEALDLGVTLFDTAALYGFGANETLVGRVLKSRRESIVLCTKGGMAGEPGPDGALRRVIDGSPKALRRHCEDSLKRLQTETIDLYTLHRWDPRVPVAESVGEMARLRAEGKVRALGLSEVSAATLKLAHAEHPIAAVQSEYSLWTRNPEIALSKACSELGVALVAFSPVARGFLSDAVPDPAHFDAKDIRLSIPRFAAPHWQANLALLPAVKKVANDAGCTLAQAALAWLLAQGEHVLAIPGTTSLAHLQENCAAAHVTLSAAQLKKLGDLVNQCTVSGNRYGEQARGEVDSEVFAEPAR